MADRGEGDRDARTRPLCHVNLARGYRGGERQTELLIRRLAEQGVEQRALLRAGQPLIARLQDVPGLTTIPAGKPYLRHLGQLRGCLLHAHEAGAAHLAHWAGRVADCLYVITRRVDIPPSRNVVTRRVYRRAAGVAALSQAIAGVLRAQFGSLPITVIPSACAGFESDPDRAASLRCEWGGEFVVSQVAALDDSQKGQTYLIHAARRLAAEQAGWRFVLVGGGPDEAALRAEARGLDDVVIFTGHVDNVGDYLAASDVFAFPSLHEGLGSALLDAMAFGLPVAASDVDGIPEIIRHEREGLLVPPADEARLADALRTLRDQPDMRQRLSESGRSRARAYGSDRMAERYLAWYRSLGFRVAGSPDPRNAEPVGEQRSQAAL